jgi:hypothetical protein
VPDNTLASHKPQNTGFRSANQVELDFFSIAPETVALAKPPRPSPSSRSAVGWSGFCLGEL